MTAQEILEAQELIADMRDDQSLIAGSSNDNAEKLPALALEKGKQMEHSFRRLLQLSAINGEDYDEASYGWLAIKTAGQLAGEGYYGPAFMPELVKIVTQSLPRVHAVLEKIGQELPKN
jgi:hypothetical protein